MVQYWQYELKHCHKWKHRVDPEVTSQTTNTAFAEQAHGQTEANRTITKEPLKPEELLFYLEMAMLFQGNETARQDNRITKRFGPNLDWIYWGSARREAFLSDIFSIKGQQESSKTSLRADEVWRNSTWPVVQQKDSLVDSSSRPLLSGENTQLRMVFLDTSWIPLFLSC